MYELGWRVFRDAFGRDVPPERLRRAVAIGAAVAGLVAVALVVIGGATHWPDLRQPPGWFGTGLVVVGVGAFAVAAVPLHTRPTAAGRRSWSGTAMQAPERTERYLRMRTAPTIDPRDRDEVLRDAEMVRAGLVPEVFRGMLVVPGVLLMGIGILLIDTHLQIIGFVSVVLVVRVVTTVVRLGRVERVRGLAEALPPLPTTADRGPSGPRGAGSRPHRDRPTGSKLSLPGE